MRQNFKNECNKKLRWRAAAYIKTCWFCVLWIVNSWQEHKFIYSCSITASNNLTLPFYEEAIISGKQNKAKIYFFTMHISQRISPVMLPKFATWEDSLINETIITVLRSPWNLSACTIHCYIKSAIKNKPY